MHKAEYRYGVVSYADSLDCVGVLGRSIDTVQQVFGKSIIIWAELDLTDRLHIPSGPKGYDLLTSIGSR